MIWRTSAKDYIEKAIEQTRKDSDKNADIVANPIFFSIEKAAKFPYRFPPDKYRQNNNALFRAFEFYNFRIPFHISDKTLRIIRTRHVKQKPSNY